ncbi:MAG: hypothetical protein ABL925_06295 [Methylococcales bacterium]
MKNNHQFGLLAAVLLATIAGSVQAKSLLPGSVCFAKNEVDRAFVKFNEDNYPPTPTGRRGIINGGGFPVPVVCPIPFVDIFVPGGLPPAPYGSVSVGFNARLPTMPMTCKVMVIGTKKGLSGRAYGYVLQPPADWNYRVVNDSSSVTGLNVLPQPQTDMVMTFDNIPLMFKDSVYQVECDLPPNVAITNIKTSF